jgi:hypothetical protein
MGCEGVKNVAAGPFKSIWHEATLNTNAGFPCGFILYASFYVGTFESINFEGGHIAGKLHCD